MCREINLGELRFPLRRMLKLAMCKMNRKGDSSRHILSRKHIKAFDKLTNCAPTLPFTLRRFNSDIFRLGNQPARVGYSLGNPANEG